MLSALNNVFGQKIRETSFAFGINKTSSPVQHNYWNENSSPTYLTFNATKSWYNNDHRFSIRKEAGLNLQYSNINLDSGGLGGHNYYSGNITSLFADAALLVQLRFVDKKWIFKLWCRQLYPDFIFYRVQERCWWKTTWRINNPAALKFSLNLSIRKIFPHLLELQRYLTIFALLLKINFKPLRLKAMLRLKHCTTI